MTDLTGTVELRAFDVLWRLLGLTSNTPDWCAIRDWVTASTTPPIPASPPSDPLATQRAEVQRLREALEQIADEQVNPRITAIASAALASEQSEGPPG